MQIVLCIWYVCKSCFSEKKPRRKPSKNTRRRANSYFVILGPFKIQLGQAFKLWGSWGLGANALLHHVFVWFGCVPLQSCLGQAQHQFFNFRGNFPNPKFEKFVIGWRVSLLLRLNFPPNTKFLIIGETFPTFPAGAPRAHRRSRIQNP